MQDKFISNIKDQAIADMKQHGILASLTIAQAILESGWGRSELATKANNLFGIKINNAWRGDKYSVKTAEYDDKGNKYYIDAYFRKYSSWQDSIADHTMFLLKARYSNLIGKTNYKEICNLILQDGYSTDPEYAKQLIALIEKYKLYEFDSRL